jgi:hypothetical protein
LTFVTVDLGTGAPGGSLIINTNLVSSGKLGLAVALPSNATFAVGTQQVVVVSFLAAALPVDTSTTVSFSDTPTARELSDPGANGLAATYANVVIAIAAATFEGDVAPRPNGDKSVTVIDWVLAGRYAARLDFPTNTSEFQRADCAPRATLGDGQITVSDWVQTGRYAAAVDPLTVAGGPTGESPLRRATDTLNRGQKHGSNRQVTVTSALVRNGQTGTVAVDLLAQGNENAIGCSLSFDPTVFTFAGASTGSGTAGATVNINTNQANAGKLGFVLALPTGKTFPTGTLELVKLAFQAGSTASGTYPVTLGSSPVPREVADTNAVALTTDYINGTLALNLLPSLSIVATNQQITLAWPSWASGFFLQESTTLSPPGQNWSNAPIVGLISNNENLVTIPISSTNKFYRLLQQ